MLSELGNGDVLNGDAVVGIGRDHRVALPVVVRGGQRRLEIRKHGVIDCNDVGVAMEICDGLVAEIRHENEGIASIGTGCRGASQRRLGRGAGLCGASRSCRLRALECELVVRSALPRQRRSHGRSQVSRCAAGGRHVGRTSIDRRRIVENLPVPDESWSKSHPEWV